MTMTIRNSDLINDLNIIAAAVKQAAIDNDLCSEYDEFVETVNRKTSQAWIESRQQTHTISLTVDIEIVSRDADMSIADWKDHFISWVDGCQGNVVDGMDCELDDWAVSA